MALTAKQQADLFTRVDRHIPAWLAEIKALLGAVPRPFLFRELGHPAVYVADGTGVTYRHVRDQAELRHLVARCGPVREWNAGTRGVAGVLVGPDPREAA